jgi:hypothetical protein
VTATRPSWTLALHLRWGVRRYVHEQNNHAYLNTKSSNGNENISRPSTVVSTAKA